MNLKKDNSRKNKTYPTQYQEDRFVTAGLSHLMGLVTFIHSRIDEHEMKGRQPVYSSFWHFLKLIPPIF